MLVQSVLSRLLIATGGVIVTWLLIAWAMGT
jgi:hypothetical protein